MFDFGLIEFLFILLVALIFIGPQELPTILYKSGRLLRQVSIMWHRTRNDIADVMHEVELDEYRKEISQAQQNQQDINHKNNAD